LDTDIGENLPASPETSSSKQSEKTCRVVLTPGRLQPAIIASLFSG
jgi:hypothetical protein